jgi:hypothetical protein
VKVPAAVGVPESTPVLELRVTPVGRLPEEMDQVIGATPPVTLNESEYGFPITPLGNEFAGKAGIAATVPFTVMPRDGCATEVAVRTNDPGVTGAVTVTEVLDSAERVAPPVAVQVTPWFEGSFVTVA